jgi:hypothetical protein
MNNKRKMKKKKKTEGGALQLGYHYSEIPSDSWRETTPYLTPEETAGHFVPPDESGNTPLKHLGRNITLMESKG